MSIYLCPALYEPCMYMYVCAIALGLRRGWNAAAAQCALSNGRKRWHHVQRKRRAIESRTKAQKKEMFTTLGRHINLRMKSCAFRPLCTESSGYPILPANWPETATWSRLELPFSHVIAICHCDLWSLFRGERQGRSCHFLVWNFVSFC